MQSIKRTHICEKCYTVIKTGRGKRIAPGVLGAGESGRQCRTAYLFFDGGVCTAEPETAFLYVFVRGAQLCGWHETVRVHSVLPCGAPAPVEAHAAFEVSRHFCGWKAVDIGPLLAAIREALHGAPFGLALSVASPSLVTFSTEPTVRPRVAVDETEGCRASVCRREADTCLPCGSAVDICAPETCGYGPSGSGIRVESQTWDIVFEEEDHSVLRHVERMKQGTFFVSNTGEEELMATVETSFDAVHWAHDTQKAVKPGETQAIVAKYYGKLHRMTLSAEASGKALVEFVGQYYAYS